MVVYSYNTDREWLVAIVRGFNGPAPTLSEQMPTK
jgi:hypothetical protein